MDQRFVKAAREGDVDTLHNLLKEDPQILEEACSVHFEDSALHVAARSGKTEFVEQIVTRMPSLATETNQQGMIPLHLASLKGHVETVRELLKAKLDDDDDGVNQCLVKDDEGWTPLHCASQKGKIQAMEELIIKCPQCLEQVTAKRETVLHVAVKANQFEAVKVLADSIRRHNLRTVFKAKDQKGKSAYQLAAAKKQLQVVEVLKEENETGEISINVKREGSEIEASSKNEESNELKSQQNGIQLVATVIITLTYQALTNPPSSFLKEGSTRVDWDCLRQKQYHGLAKLSKDCPSAMAFLFMLFNSMIFLQAIYILVVSFQGQYIVAARQLAMLLVVCYCCLLMDFYYNAVYLAIPSACLALASLYWSSRQAYAVIFSIIVTKMRAFLRRRAH